MAAPRPYGTWPSPLSAADLAGGSVHPSNLAAAGDRLAWTEGRPAEGGRQALVEWRDGERVDVTPVGWNTRTRVHEYGGAPFVLTPGLLLASRWEDQRLHRLSPDADPVPVTPEPAGPATTRWADGVVTPDARWLVAVRETHEDDEVRNEIVAVHLATGDEVVLVTGRDFVAAPRLSPDGASLAWLAWDHPDMPWDGAELWVAGFADGAVDGAQHVLGGGEASVCSLAWLADGRLAATEDSSGYWEVHVGDPHVGLERVTWFGADCGGPAWQFGQSSLAQLPDGRLACIVTERATHQLVLVEPDTSVVEEVSLPYAYLDRIRPYGDGVAMLVAETGGARGVVLWSPDGGVTELVRYEPPALRAGDAPVPEPIEVGTPDGEVTHAFLYRPVSADVTPDEDSLPPLVVFTHGGPTGNVHPVLTPSIAYWTTRGFAVADVNYRGSTGFGRAYRDALRGRWGELDVEDAMAVARGLAEAKVVDGDRMAIRGGSAGGYTTLAVLTTPEHPFACGTSFFGVGDLAALAADTHKFESRYLDQVVGPLPEAAELYAARSPVNRAELLSRPLLVLQGLEDEVVPPAQAEAIVAAAARAGVPHAYIAFEGEQHGFRRAENIVTWLESELAFYGQVMGFEPAGDLPHLELA